MSNAQGPPRPDFRIPEPRPLPDSIRAIADSTFQQKAADAWRAASLLRRLMERWEQWHHELRTTGDADPGVTNVLYEKVSACVRALYRLGADIGMIREKSADELVSIFPPLPSGVLADLDENGQLVPAPWQQEPKFRQAMLEAVRRPEWKRLLRELMGFMRDLEAAPSAAFVEPAKGKQLKGTGKQKGKGGRNPLQETDTKRQVYERIQRENGRPAAKRERLEADKDFMDLFRKSGLKWKTVFDRTRAFFYRRNNNKLQ